MGIKENWNKTDELCSHCEQVTKRVRGITKQNIRRLLIPKFNSTEIIITILLIMFFFLAFLYNAETKSCRDWLKPMQQGYDKCIFTCDDKCRLMNQEQINYSNFTGLNTTKNVPR